ncbi:hypothetical protein R3P38DRAFT_2814137 [Favolaschia claudopus]|uniref:BZIP domain-containing protein n=1 Tax=Favolaschia claudopus TaxID=2862362 RepID=A0AAV9Z485_9AGAR
MGGYTSPKRLPESSKTRPGERNILLFRFFLNLSLGFLLGSMFPRLSVSFFRLPTWSLGSLPSLPILATIFVGLSSYLWYGGSSAQDCVRYAPTFRLRGGDASDDGEMLPSEHDSFIEASFQSTYPQTTMIAFSPSSNLLGAIGNSEGAQAQGLADVIILRQMNRDSPAWWAHKVSYPWLLVSLNRYLSHMNKRYWDLTPNDTNPIEGSHAEDNQIKPTNRPILEAILFVKEQDAQNARIIQEMISSGVLQNRNNSLQSRMKSQAQRKARASEKKRIADAELLTVKESRQLRNNLEATQQENETLRKQIAMLSQASFSATPSTPKKLQPVARVVHLNFELADSDSDDFDYAAALNSDIISPIFKKIARDHPMPGIDDECN